MPWRDLLYASVGWGSVDFTDDFQSASADVTRAISGAAPLHSRSGRGFSGCLWPASPEGGQWVAAVPSPSSRVLSGSISIALSRWHQLLTGEQTKLVRTAQRFRKQAINTR